MSKLHMDILDEVIKANMTSEDDVWQMFFDGASRIGPISKTIAGGGVVLVSLENYAFPCVFSLTKPCSNIVAEYNALLIGL